MSRSKRSKNKGSKYIGTLQRRSRDTRQGGNYPTLFLLKGTLQITRSGMGFVIADDSNVEGDVMVRPQEFHTALNGDKVEVAVFKENKSTGKKEGKIERVLLRKQVEFVGHLELSSHFAFFIADGNKQMPDIYVPLDKSLGAEDQAKVIVRLLKWDEGRKPLGKVIATLAQEDINDAAMKELLIENGFPIQFEKEVIDAANALPLELDKQEIKLRKDFRKKLTFTIDPNDSKDFDDAISFRKISKDKFEVGVHIADVSYYVRPGSVLDKEAYKRATSVYLPDRVNPMLPENISNMLCSLRPNEDKFTFSAVFTMDLSGKVLKSWIGKTVIHSDRRYTYDEVQEVITGGSDTYKEALLTLNTISQSLRKKRFEKGAINFSSHEVRFKLDAKGKPIDIILNETNESHQLIEELMLLANRTVAEYAQTIKVGDKSIPFPYRIHDQPDSTKLEPFVAFTRKLGYKFDLSTPDTIAVSYNKMLEACAGKPEEMMIQQLGIRTMAKAAYAPENIGHYGLGFKDYCHFTSPIRRYPDIIVHRTIEECLQGNKPVDEEMSLKCKHCSERERASLETERAANKYKQVEFMREFVGDEFEAIVSGVSNFGFWAETITAKCEGLVSIKDLADFDEFTLIEEEYALVGTHTKQKFRMGDHVWIRVAAANLEKRQIDYEWLPNGVAGTETTQQPITEAQPVVDEAAAPRAKTPARSRRKQKTTITIPVPEPIAEDVKKTSSLAAIPDKVANASPIKNSKMKKTETAAASATSQKPAPKKIIKKVAKTDTAAPKTKIAVTKATKPVTKAAKTATEAPVTKIKPVTKAKPVTEKKTKTVTKAKAVAASKPAAKTAVAKATAVKPKVAAPAKANKPATAKKSAKKTPAVTKGATTVAVVKSKKAKAPEKVTKKVTKASVKATNASSAKKATTAKAASKAKPVVEKKTKTAGKAKAITASKAPAKATTKKAAPAKTVTPIVKASKKVKEAVPAKVKPAPKTKEKAVKVKETKAIAKAAKSKVTVSKTPAKPTVKATTAKTKAPKTAAKAPTATEKAAVKKVVAKNINPVKKEATPKLSKKVALPKTATKKKATGKTTAKSKK